MKILLFLLTLTMNALALNPGDTAPNFELTDQNGKKVSLQDFKGKFVVLEWYNEGCPYVRKHYDAQNMQTTQKIYHANEDVVWLSIVSSVSGKQGHIESPAMALETMKREKSYANHLLLDLDGKVGKAYDAKTTPHMYLLSPDMKVAYVGAIDSIASADKSDIKKARNYVTSSMSKIMLKETPDPQKTKPYGCSVKY